MITNPDCLDRHGVLFISVTNEAGVYVARTELGERPITAISAVERDLAALELARKVFGDNLSETDLLIAITQSSPGLTRYMAKVKGGVITESEYRQHPAANFSTLKWLLKSPAHCKSIMDGEKEVEVTSAMAMGTAVHAFWLEGIVPVEGVTYRRKPAGMNFASKEGKAWRDSNTLPILTAEEEAIQHSMVKALAESPHCRRLLELAPHRETPLFATIEGVEVKCRVDACGPGVMLDLKTTNDASPKKFGSIAWERHYDMQAWFYREILLQNELISDNAPGIWLAVENTGTPIVMPYYITGQFVESGREKAMRCLALWKQCHETGAWPGYPMPEDGTPAIPEFPRWATSV